MKLSTLTAAVACFASVLGRQPTVATKHGSLQGGICEANAEVNYFASIPYAEPPVGDRRFTAPRAYGSFGQRNATVKAPACPQFGTMFVESGSQSEDCLFLDVWAPAHATARSRLPIKVWLYGGGDSTGGISNPMYDGCYSATDSILVSINYRLGPLGFLSLQDAGFEGNYGTQDIFLALRWIKENIAAFGGDPDQVVLFGQSAGALDTYIVAASREAKSLINAAVMMSAGGTLPTPSLTEPWNKLFVKGVNCSSSDVNCLRSKTVEEFQSVVLSMPRGVGPDVGGPLEHLGRGLLMWGPVIDGKVIPVQPSQYGVQVPSLFGSAVNEGTLFVLGAYGEDFATLNQTDYDLFLSNHFGSQAQAVNTTYPPSKFPPTATSPNSFASAIQAIMRDRSFLCLAHDGLVSGQKNKVPVFSYSWEHTPSCTWLSAVPQSAFVHAFVGPAHTADIPFAFGTLTGLPFEGNPHNCSLTAAEAQMSAFLRTSFTNMARHRNPGHGWPLFTTEAETGMVFSSNGASTGDIDYKICDFWRSLGDA